MRGEQNHWELTEERTCNGEPLWVVWCNGEYVGEIFRKVTRYYSASNSDPRRKPRLYRTPRAAMQAMRTRMRKAKQLRGPHVND